MTIDPSFPRGGIQRGGWAIPGGVPSIAPRDEASLLTAASFGQPEYVVESAWLEHAPFLSWLIEAHAPKRFVELGCHSGYSYFTACQAVKRHALCTECFAVDTWRGDEHTGFYGDEVFQAVSAHNHAHYSAFSHLIRSTFADAVALFPDASIDLLHVDGRHFYEDVLEDLAAWRPKLSEDAILLLHDTVERDRKFGIWRLFDELRGSYPTFEFTHGHGLGVVAFGRVPDALESLFNLSTEKRGFLRIAYATLGRAITERWMAAERDAESAHRDDAFAALQAETTQLRSQLDSAKEAAERLGIDLGELRTAQARAVAQLSVHHATIRQLTDAEIQIAETLASARREISALKDENADLRNSSSWRVTEPLRRLSGRHPRVVGAAFGAARVGWWLVTFKFRRIAERIRAGTRLRRDEALLAGDVMFDAAHYSQIVPGGDLKGLSPAAHYLRLGSLRHLSPHPLFDGRWYAEEYGDIGGQDPLIHYIRHGRALARKPNALFDPEWYRREYPEVAAGALDPVSHFLTEGAAKGFNPSPLFNTRFYLSHYPDVARTGFNPLAHYLRYGQAEGRECKGYEVDARIATPVTAVPIECRKRPLLRNEVALFVTHSPNGRLRPHLRHYLEALAREGVATTLIVAADRGFTEDEPWLLELVDGLYVRGNEGWDFAAWAHVLRLNRQLYRAEILYWLNDSVIGPVNQPSFHALLERVRQEPAGLVGLTANHERGFHIQSYFWALKRRALESVAFQEFLHGIKCFPDKDDAINAYEIKLSPKLAAAGIPTAALFKPPGQHNPTIYNWKALLEQGFAFLKVAAITNDIRHVDKSGWREALDAHGYDVVLADRLLSERQHPTMERAGPVDWCPAPSLPNDPPQVSFIAPFNYANGLAVAARGYLSAMMHMGWPVNALPISRPFHIHRRVAPGLRSIEFAGAPDVAVVHLNPDSWEALLDAHGREAIAAARYRIGAFVWESNHPSRGFAEKMGALSAIWAPSRYCASVFEQVTATPVHLVHYAVPVRPIVNDMARLARIRAEIGLEPDCRIMLYSFDASSYLARKNPLALLRAFERTGLAGQGWRLVLKTKHLAAAADGVALAEATKKVAGAVLVDRLMGTGAAHALLGAADVYVSPHAAEGFGLTIAEAMAQGKPVIATDYSGSADFLDASCGFPVRWRPWQLDRDMGPYPQGTNWAQVDEDSLAETLMTVAALDPAERAAIGGKARQRIETQLSPAAVALQMRESVESLIGRTPP